MPMLFGKKEKRKIKMIKHLQCFKKQNTSKKGEIMKKLQRLTVLLSLTLTFALLIPQIPVVPNSTIETYAAMIKLNKKKATLYEGKTLQLKVSGTKKKVYWKSSNKKIATVSTKGKVIAKKKGTSTITAKIGKKKLTCKITVKKKDSSFTYSADGYKLKYLYYKLGKNSSGEKCIITYWNFTNKSGKSEIPYWALSFKAYQNGIELTPYSSYDDKYPEVDICYNKNVQNGKTVKIAYMHKITGKSPVSIEISPMLLYPDTKIGNMKIKIK